MSAYVITVAQQKGGCGKTTLAIQLATAFAKRGLSTLLFDIDPQGTSSQWHSRRKHSDVGLIATSGWRLSKDLSMAKEANDIIVIDSPPHAEMDAKVAIRAADLVVMPMQPSPADLWAVRETAKIAEIERQDSVVVLNRVVPRAGITQDVIDRLSIMGIPTAKTHIGSRVAFAHSMEDGETVLDLGSSPSADEIYQLVDELGAMLGIKSKAAPKKTTAKAKVAEKKAEKSTETKATTKKSSTKKTTTKKTPAKKATSSVKKETTAKKPAKATTAKKSSVKVATSKVAAAKKTIKAKATVRATTRKLKKTA